MTLQNEINNNGKMGENFHRVVSPFLFELFHSEKVKKEKKGNLFQLFFLLLVIH